MIQFRFVTLLLIAASAHAADKQEQFDDLHKLTADSHPIDELPAEKLEERALEVLLEEMFPANPEQLRNVQDRQRELDNAIHQRAAPAALTGIIPVSTRPGAQPVEVLVAPYHTSSLNVIDATGQPWPISAVMYGNGSDYQIAQVDAHAFANIVRIDARREVGSTNLNLSLVDLPTTLTVTLVNSADRYHPSPILQIDREGPQAQPLPVVTATGVEDDALLKNILLGIAPDGYRRLASSDAAVEAWRHDGSLYLRTRYQPLSPLPRGVHHGPAGYAAYRLNDMPVLVMTTRDGHEKRVTLTEGQ